MAKGNRKSGIQLVVMILLTCLSQFLALYKARYTATNFGATDYMDAYNFSVTIASFVFVFVSSGVTTVIVPAYVKKKDPRVVDSFITIVYGCALLAVALILIFRKPLVTAVSSRSAEYITYVCDFLFISFLIHGITAFLAVTTAYFQCIDHYIIPKAVMLISNLAVAVVLFLGLVHSIEQYLLLLVAGAVLNLVCDLWIAFCLGFRYLPRIVRGSEELRSMLKIFLPTLFSAGVYKIHGLIDTWIASNLAEGQLTILSYSTQVMSMINTVIIGNLTVYAYPKIVARLGQDSSKKNFRDYTILFHAVVCLLIAGFVNVGLEGVSLIFLGGRFTADHVAVLYRCICIYIFGQQFNIVRDLFYRYFYANGDTKTTFANSIIVSISNIVLSLILVRLIGLTGIVLGTILSSALSLCMIVLRYHKKFGIESDLRETVAEYAKNLLAMTAAVLLIRLIRGSLSLKMIPAILVYGTATVLIYLLILLLLGSRIRKVRL